MRRRRKRKCVRHFILNTYDQEHKQRGGNQEKILLIYIKSIKLKATTTTTKDLNLENGKLGIGKFGPASIILN